MPKSKSPLGPDCAAVDSSAHNRRSHTQWAAGNNGCCQQRCLLWKFDRQLQQRRRQRRQLPAEQWATANMYGNELIVGNREK
jgi:hypothetical protein